MDDELISEARKIAIDFNGVEQKLKPVHLQHRMRIGINRATKLYEQLKNEGLVQQSPREAVLFCAQKKEDHCFRSGPLNKTNYVRRFPNRIVPSQRLRFNQKGSEQ